MKILSSLISKTSEALGRKYQNFVRKNNPELAERVEQYFLNSKLPLYWEKTPEGSYTVSYNQIKYPLSPH